MPPRKIPARLDVILAPKARKAVGLRRGPAKLVCSLGWNLEDDSFEVGHPGGGLFLTENRYWLNNAWYPHQESDEVVYDPHYPGDDFAFDCRNVYIRRQLRDGWKLVNRVGDVVGCEMLTFQKSLTETWVIRNKFDNSDIGLKRGACPSDYQLLNVLTGEVRAQPTWEWADVDGDRLLWAEAGKIFAAGTEAQVPGSAIMLYDFNDMSFQKIEAPY